MAVQLNHTIVHARDSDASAEFLSGILGLGPPGHFSHFRTVTLGNGVSLDFAATDQPVVSQHYAFLVSEEEFDTIFARIRERGLDYWADPSRARPGEINRRNGGRGVYFPDPDGHFLEIFTLPGGSGS